MYRTILVGTDGSPTATEAVKAAFAVAAPLGAHVHLVSVNDDSAAARSVLQDAEALTASLGVAHTQHIMTGHVGRAIIECATNVEADLVVVGDQGMHGVNRLLSGSVPNYIAHNAPCSVLLVDSTRRVDPPLRP